MSLVYLDTETTGLDPTRHEIWEIAYAVDDGPVEVSCVEHDARTADGQALVISRYEERMQRGDWWHRPALQFELRLKAVIAGATLVAANPAFDTAFLRARWGAAPWKYRLLDIEAYAMGALDLDEPRGLAFIAEQCGVRQPNHTAAGDVVALRDCHHALRDMYASRQNDAA